VKKETSRKTINRNTQVAGQCILKVTRGFVEMVNLELKRTILDENSNRPIWQKCQLDHEVTISKKAMSK
jgi:hypothetical protein